MPTKRRDWQRPQPKLGAIALRLSPPNPNDAAGNDKLAAEGKAQQAKGDRAGKDSVKDALGSDDRG